MGKKLDKCMVSLAVIYIVFPTLLFLFGWIKFPIALFVSVLIIFLAISIIKSIEVDAEISITKNIRFWLFSFAIIAVWTLFSGIGNFSYQTGDYSSRNPMFRDLGLYSWPVTYDLSIQPDIVKNFTGDAQNAMYVYYFTWWLPAASVARVLYTMGVETLQVENISNVVLYLWAVLGLCLTFYCLVRYLRKYSYWILSGFILFGGLDFFSFLIKEMRLPVNDHIEWWAGGACNYFQYSANTTQLYWVFNQSIPVWLIVAVLLNLRNSKNKAGWASLCVAYSPFATIGMVPIAVDAILHKDGNKLKTRIQNAVSIENTLIPASMAIIFGLFYYLEIEAGAANSGLIMKTNSEFRTFTIYVIFIIVEFLVYFCVMGKTARKYKFYFVTLIELLLFPLYRSGMYNDFTMRASIPALFILMVMCLQYVFEMEDAGEKKKQKVMLTCLLAGYLTSCTEIQRNVSETLNVSQEEYLKEDVYSFGCMQTENEGQIMLNLNQYMVLDDELEKSLFYKYLLK